MKLLSLNRRQRILLRLLYAEQAFKPISYFAQALGVSHKTVKEDLKQLRSWLEVKNVTITGKTGQGICLSNKDADSEIMKAMSLQDDEGVLALDSSEHRRAHILKNMLIFSHKYTSLKKLSEKYFVSRSSIVNDLKYIELWILQHQLRLERTSEGTRVIGDESCIRNAIADLLSEQKNEIDGGASHISFQNITRIDEVTRNGLIQLFDLEQVVFVEMLLNDLDGQEDIHISDIYYINLLTHILICINRVRVGNGIKKTEEGHKYRSDMKRKYRLASEIIEKIEKHYQIDIGEGETFYLYQYLISLSTPEAMNDAQGDDDSESRKIAVYLTECMSEILKVDFSKETALLDGLLLHIRPMLNRMKYHIRIKNPLLQEMNEWYPRMMGICQLAFCIVGRRWGLEPISIDEISNLATYYQTMLVKMAEPKRILVVCHSGFGTSQLLTVKLKQEFPSFDIVEVISSRKLERMDLSGIDLIITTVPVIIPAVPYILISALLTEEDIQKIRRKIGNVGNDYKSYMDLTFLQQELTKSFDKDFSFTKTPVCICKASLLPDLKVEVWESDDSLSLLNLSIDDGADQIIFRILLKDGISNDVYIKLIQEIYWLTQDNKRVSALRFMKSPQELTVDFEEETHARND